MSEIHYRTCHLCEPMCGLSIEHADGKILSIQGDPQHVLSKGEICPQPLGLTDIHIHPDRLHKTMKWAYEI